MFCSLPDSFFLPNSFAMDKGMPFSKLVVRMKWWIGHCQAMAFFLNIRCGPSAKMGNSTDMQRCSYGFLLFHIFFIVVVVAEILLGSFNPGGW